MYFTIYTTTIEKHMTIKETIMYTTSTAVVPAKEEGPSYLAGVQE